MFRLNRVQFFKREVVYKCPQTIEEKIENIYVQYCSNNNLSVEFDTWTQLDKIEQILQQISTR